MAGIAYDIKSSSGDLFLHSQPPQRSGAHQTRLSRYSRKGTFLRYIPGALSSFGTLLLSVAGVIRLVFLNQWAWVFGVPTIAGIAAVFIGGIWKLFLREEKDLPLWGQSNYKQSYSKNIKVELAIFSKLLGFGDTERISLFQPTYEQGLDNEVTSLLMIGRYSRRKTFDLKGRGVIPLDHGMVAMAWKGGELDCHVKDLPEDEIEYSNECEQRFNMPYDVTKALRMKSRSLYVYFLRDEVYNWKKAALVFESLDPDGIDVELIKEWMGNKSEDLRLSLMINSLSDIPDPNAASREGF